MTETHRRMIELAQHEPYRSMPFDVAWEAARRAVNGSRALWFWA